jgi:hypothetical protein
VTSLSLTCFHSIAVFVDLYSTYERKHVTSLAIMEMQIKTILRFTSLLLEWLPSRTQTTRYVGQDVGKKETSHTAGRDVN